MRVIPLSRRKVIIEKGIGQNVKVWRLLSRHTQLVRLQRVVAESEVPVIQSSHVSLD